MEKIVKEVGLILSTYSTEGCSSMSPNSIIQKHRRLYTKAVAKYLRSLQESEIKGYGEFYNDSHFTVSSLFQFTITTLDDKLVIFHYNFDKPTALITYDTVDLNERCKDIKIEVKNLG